MIIGTVAATVGLAAIAGPVLAAEVILHPGAVIPKEAMPAAETVFG